MVTREFVAKQAARQILPLVRGMSDKDLERMLWLVNKMAPTDTTRAISNSLERMRQEGHPLFDLLRRAIRQTNPHVRERLANSLIINELMDGGVRRRELSDEGLAAPQAYLISPTMRCNLHCKGCYAANYSQEDELELEVIDRVLTEGKELGMYWVTILGGEPFIRQDMWEMYKRHNDVFFQVFTNGTLIDKDVARKLAEVGNVLVVFSIEGFEEETDARRGKGVFKKIMQGMDNLRQAGVAFGFSAMATRHNVDLIIGDEGTDEATRGAAHP
jgi:hypothetical protein